MSQYDREYYWYKISPYQFIIRSCYFFDSSFSDLSHLISLSPSSYSEERIHDSYFLAGTKENASKRHSDQILHKIFKKFLALIFK